jgi:CBS domain-containing protein
MNRALCTGAYVNNFPISHIIEFLGTVDPFGSLSTTELNEIVTHLEIAFYPKNYTIIRQGDPPPDYLFIIHTGSVKATTEDANGNQVLIDVLDKGDIFGAPSILEGKISLLTISTEEDLIALQLPSSEFIKLHERHEAFKKSFQFSIARYFSDMRKSINEHNYHAITLNSNWYGDMIGMKVHDLMVYNVITCPLETTIRGACKLMAEHNIGSIIATGDSRHASGIITDSDLRNKVISKGISIDNNITQIMSSPVVIINAGEYAFDAIIKMSHYGISHLVVCEGEHMVGIISDHDLRIAIGSSPVGLIADIDRSQHVDDMKGFARKIDKVLEALLRQGFPVESAVDLITEMHDRITLNLLRITENIMIENGRGNHPVSYCWMALGSEGRREQTLRTDQDNALIYVSVPDKEEREVKDWFAEFSDIMVTSLVKCGFPKCPGGIMASNPAWCQTDSRWRDIFSNWINSPDNLALRMVTIFFDFRPIFEDVDICNPLRRHIHEMIQSRRIFLALLAKNALENQPPVGFIRQVIFERTGESKNKFDLKMKGIMPIIECARVIALDLAINSTNTIKRLREIKEQKVIGETLYNDIREAFNFMIYLRIDHHLNTIKDDDKIDNTIDVSLLNSIHRKMLKECFNATRRFQRIVETRYNTATLRSLLL